MNNKKLFVNHRRVEFQLFRPSQDLNVFRSCGTRTKKSPKSVDRGWFEYFISLFTLDDYVARYFSYFSFLWRYLLSILGSCDSIQFFCSLSSPLYSLTRLIFLNLLLTRHNISIHNFTTLNCGELEARAWKGQKNSLALEIFIVWVATPLTVIIWDYFGFRAHFWRFWILWDIRSC